MAELVMDWGGVILGGVLGGLIAALIVGVPFYFFLSRYLRRRR